MAGMLRRAERGSRLRAFLRAITSHYLPAVLICIVAVLSASFADYQKRKIADENMRAAVTTELSLIRAKLEGNINGSTQLVQGLVATLETEPDMTQQRFSELADRIFKTESQIRTLAAAPDLVVRMVYPLAENVKIIGMDYRQNVAQSTEAMQVIATGRRAITGPVDLAQGGRGLIVRYPVANARAEGPKYWGIMSAMLDLQKLYVDSGIEAADLPIEVAIAGGDAAGQFGSPFLGEASTFRNAPVEMTINLGRESWRIAATPKAGWHQLPDDIWLFRLILAGVGLMVIIPMVWVGRLMAERAQNIQALQQREEQLNTLSHRLDMALETSKIGIWEFDVGSGDLFWDERMRDLYDVSPTKRTCDYSDWRDALHPDDLEEATRAFADTFKSGNSYESEFRIVTKSGELRHVRSIGITYRDYLGRLKVVGVNWNVTADIELQDALRQAQGQTELQNRQLDLARSQMEHNALHDALTQLPNRRYLDQILAERNHGGDTPSPLTVMHIDLDRFKDINDTLGHAAGDEILRHTAAVLKENIRPDDFIARIGGDEFVLVSEVRDCGIHYADLARKICDDLSVPINYQGHECRAGVSIGVASRSAANEKAEQVLINADIALYEAKRRGRNRSEFFTDTLRSSVVTTKQTADEILRGLEQNEFIAYFQPQFDANTLEISGVEALVRWDHPSKGILAPDAFLKIAEGLNIVSTIDRIVMEQALFHFYQWTASGLDIPKVSVNISAQRLHDQALFEKLEALDIRPGTLCFELLESISFDENDETLVANIQRIKALGIDIEIDDFGTGYASIINLLKLTPRRLKIDRQLIKPILTCSTERQLVSSIIDIGKACGIEIVAEGVETMAHATLLRDLGCHILQGYAFARPMSPTDFMSFARERRWLDGTTREAPVAKHKIA